MQQQVAQMTVNGAKDDSPSAVAGWDVFNAVCVPGLETPEMLAEIAQLRLPGSIAAADIRDNHKRGMYSPRRLNEDKQERLLTFEKSLIELREKLPRLIWEPPDFPNLVRGLALEVPYALLRYGKSALFGPPEFETVRHAGLQSLLSEMRELGVHPRFCAGEKGQGILHGLLPGFTQRAEALQEVSEWNSKVRTQLRSLSRLRDDIDTFPGPKRDGEVNTWTFCISIPAQLVQEVSSDAVQFYNLSGLQRLFQEVTKLGFWPMVSGEPGGGAKVTARFSCSGQAPSYSFAEDN